MSLFRELLGRRGGCSGGRGGSMHLYSAENNFWGGNGIVGDQMSLAAGFSLAQKLGEKGFSIGLCGDGAANQGQIYESMNMATLWKLPLVFAIENNQYSMGTPINQSNSNPMYYKMFPNTPGIYVSSQSVFEIKAVMDFAREYVIKNGPLVIEV